MPRALSTVKRPPVSIVAVPNELICKIPASISTIEDALAFPSIWIAVFAPATPDISDIFPSAPVSVVFIWIKSAAST